MDVGSLYSLLGSQATSTVTVERKKQETFLGKSEAKGDTISISDEARALLAKMTKPMTGASSAGTERDDTGSELDRKESAEGNTGKGIGNFGSEESEESAKDTLRDIEARLKKLCEQYEAVMKRPAPEQAKQFQGQQIQDEINELMAQVRGLREQVTQNTAVEDKKAPATTA